MSIHYQYSVNTAGLPQTVIFLSPFVMASRRSVVMVHVQPCCSLDVPAAVALTLFEEYGAPKSKYRVQKLLRTRSSRKIGSTNVDQHLEQYTYAALRA